MYINRFTAPFRSVAYVGTAGGSAGDAKIEELYPSSNDTKSAPLSDPKSVDCGDSNNVEAALAAPVDAEIPRAVDSTGELSSVALVVGCGLEEDMSDSVLARSSPSSAAISTARSPDGAAARLAHALRAALPFLLSAAATQYSARSSISSLRAHDRSLATRATSFRPARQTNAWIRSRTESSGTTVRRVSGSSSSPRMVVSPAPVCATLGVRLIRRAAASRGIQMRGQDLWRRRCAGREGWSLGLQKKGVSARIT